MDELPETLDETYERALRDIDKANWEFAYRLLQCVAAAFRPLRVEELAEVLSFDFKTGSIPKFHEGWRLGDPIDAVLSTTSSLLAIVDVQGSPVIQFSHFSVKEFLTSTRLAETSNIICRRFHITMTSAHTLAAQASLGILLHLDKSVVSRECLKKYPLAGYAAGHWFKHARFEGVLRNVEDGMKRLFDPSKPYLAVWVWIYDPELPPWMQTTQVERPLQPRGPPLHYAAVCGLHTIVKFLIIEHSQDVHSRGFDDESTPLHLASREGHAGVARSLLEHGADATAQTKDGSTPLHLASEWGSKDIVLSLLEHGADAGTQTKDGSTPLHLASQRGFEGVAFLLLQHGANVAAQTNDGSIPLHLASLWGHKNVAHSLLKHGSNAEARSNDGSTPLHLASQRGYEGIARLLLEHGAGATAQTNFRLTPLHLASERGREEVVHLLLEHGANAMALSVDGQTPLHLALGSGRKEVARLLLEHGVDAAAQSNDGLTPLHLASQWGSL